MTSRSLKVPALAQFRMTSGLAALLLTVFHSASAHHSFAMFDRAKTVTLHGTVKELQWTNPHCYLQVLVPGEGAVTEWSVEMSAPGDMYRVGWRPRTLKSGDKVTVVINPLKDGTNGGMLVSAIGPGGQAVGSVRPRS